MIWAINIAKAWFHVDNRHTWLHLVEASMSTMSIEMVKIVGGATISPWIVSKTLKDLSFIF
jgi:hypothetical protein